MDWSTTALLAIGLTIVAIAQIRTVRGRRLVVLLLWLGLGLLLTRWASFRGAWPELLLAAGAALLLTTIWWFAYGRKLPPAQNSIRVWSEDDPF